MDQGILLDQGTLAGIGTVFALVTFISICIWAYSSRNKARFDEAAQLPFADDLANSGSGSGSKGENGSVHLSSTNANSHPTDGVAKL